MFVGLEISQIVPEGTDFCFAVGIDSDQLDLHLKSFARDGIYYADHSGNFHSRRHRSDEFSGGVTNKV